MTELISISVPDTVSAALLVLSGKYGINPERREKLTADGYNAVNVQNCVNELIRIFEKYSGD